MTSMICRNTKIRIHNIDEECLMDLDEDLLQDFPVGNLGMIDLSKNRFIANEIFPRLDDIIAYNNAMLCNNNQNTSTSRIKKRKEKVTGTSNSRIKRRKEKVTGTSNQFLKQAVFRDFSRMEDEEALKIEYGSSALTTTTSMGRRYKASTIELFPVKLHKIIERSEVDGYSSIISWLPHGRAFIIHNTSRFVSEILSKYFFGTRFSSFTRQLNTYGFRRLDHEKKCNNKGRGAYFHELFLRNRPGLCNGIRKLKTSRGCEEPNFYRMPPIANFPSQQKSKCYLQGVLKSNPQEKSKSYLQGISTRLATPNLPRAIIRYTNDAEDHLYSTDTAIALSTTNDAVTPPPRLHTHLSPAAQLTSTGTVETCSYLSRKSRTSTHPNYMENTDGPTNIYEIQKMVASSSNHPNEEKVKVLHDVARAQSQISYFIARGFGL